MNSLCMCDGCRRRRMAYAQREARKVAQEAENRRQYEAARAGTCTLTASCGCVFCHARKGALYCSDAK
jgi:hypothetical protein